MLLEDQEGPQLELQEESLDIETEVTQDTSDDLQFMEIEDEDSFIENEADPEQYEVLSLDEDESLDESKLEVSSGASHIALIKREDKSGLQSNEEITEKMRVAHLAKESLKRHKCPFCDKSFLYPSKGKIN